MFCSKCGTKNEEGAKFCVNCGEALTENEVQTSETTSTVVQMPQTSSEVSSPGGIRKAMKADAKKRIKGSLVGATAIYLLVCVIVSMFLGEIFKPTFSNVNYGELITDIIIGFIGVTFAFGLLSIGFRAVRDKDYEFKEVFTTPFSNTKKLGYVLIVALIVYAISFVITVLSGSTNGGVAAFGGLLSLAFLVAAIYFAPTIQAYMCMLADEDNNEDLSLQDGFKKALEITKGNRVEYYGVMFSFIGWWLLAIITLGILFIWLLPYVQLTMNNLYRRWTKEKTFDTTETGLSNGAVIGISAAGVGCGLVLLIIVFASLIVAFFAAIGIDNSEVQDFLNQFTNTNQDVYDDYNDLNDFINDYQARG